MNKKLLTVAVGAALAATTMSANAELKVFGAAQFEIGARTNTTEVEDNVGTVTTDTSTFTGRLRDNQRGRFGFKASEDIGSGMKGLAHIEYDTQGDGSNDGKDKVGGKASPCGGLGCGSGERQIWAGIKGKFGLISGGSHHGIYKTFGGVKWDPLTATNLESRGTAGMSAGSYGHNNFIDRSLRYMSPKLGPVVIGFERSFDYKDSKDNDPTLAPEDEQTGDREEGGWQLGAKGKFGPAEVIAVYSLQKVDRNPHGGGAPANAADPTRIKVGARFSFAKAHKVAVQVESLADRQGADQSETHTYVNWVGKFGQIVPQVGFGLSTNIREDENSGSDFIGAASMFQAAVTWKPSKTFRVFGGLRTQASVTDEEVRANGTLIETTTTTESVYSVGVRKDF